MPGRHEFGRLKPDVLAELSSEGFPKTRAFFCWMRRRPHPVRMSEHQYVRLKAGQAVPWTLLQSLAEYLSDTRKRPYEVSMMAIHSDGAEASESGRTADAWRWGWARLFGAITERFRLVEKAYCHGEADLRLAARMGIEAVGRAQPEAGPNSSPSEALAIGERMMGRSLDEYTSWLKSLWQEDPRTVLFSVAAKARRNGETERLGVGVIAPLAQAAYERFRSGAVEDSSLGVDDWNAPAQHLLLQMLAEAKHEEAKEKRRTSIIQVHTFMFQMAMLLEELKRNGNGPTLISIGGTPQNEQRLKSYGFAPVGSVMPLSSRPIYELAPPETVKAGTSLSAVLSGSQYDVMFAVLRLYQAMFAEERRMLEDE